jgi:dipeptidyl aminopeptidase/acylaminoacyl peptidase
MLWEAPPVQEVTTLRGHRGKVSAVTFSPDGKRLASGSFDQSVRVWDRQSGKELLTLFGHLDTIGSVSFTPDGKRLVSGDVTDWVITWDLTTGKDIPDAKDTATPGSSRSPDGRFIAYPEGDVIRVHRLTNGKENESRGYRWWVDAAPWWHEEWADKLLKAGDWFGAAFHGDRVLRENPWDAAAQVRRAYALSQMGKPTEAATTALRAMLLDPHLYWRPPLVKRLPVMLRAADTP